MQKFDQIIFWCEFPKVIAKNKIKLIDFKTEAYVTSKDIKEYNFWKKKLDNRYIHWGAWPTLPLKEGYWFSKFTKIEYINKLKTFNGIDMKIDIEPPIPYTSKLFKKFSLYLLVKDAIFETFRHKRDTRKHLWKTINSLKSKKIIISGFPFPNFISSSYGDNYKKFTDNFYRNHFLYITFFQSRILRKLIMFYYYLYVKAKLKKYHSDKLYFAVGCVGSGIFTTEPIYNNIRDFEKDLDKFLKWGIKNLVVFNLEGILTKKEPHKWINALKVRLKQ